MWGYSGSYQVDVHLFEWQALSSVSLLLTTQAEGQKKEMVPTCLVASLVHKDDIVII